MGAFWSNRKSNPKMILQGFKTRNETPSHELNKKISWRILSEVDQEKQEQESFLRVLFRNIKSRWQFPKDNYLNCKIKRFRVQFPAAEPFSMRKMMMIAINFYDNALPNCDSLLVIW